MFYLGTHCRYISHGIFFFYLFLISKQPVSAESLRHRTLQSDHTTYFESKKIFFALELTVLQQDSPIEKTLTMNKSLIGAQSSYTVSLRIT